METIEIVYPNGNKETHPLTKGIEEMYYKLANLVNKKDIIKVSNSDKYIPLYDIFSKNIYIINAQNIYHRVNNYHYRLPTLKIMNKIKESLENTDVEAFKEKMTKNINFMNNFNLDELEKNYYKLYFMSEPATSEITSCLKPSFVPFITMKPYYTKSELINLALNMNLKLSDNMEEICKTVSKNDIDSNTILAHQQYIKQRAKAYVQLYSLLGSCYWNFYLRNECYRDLYVENQIKQLYNIVHDAPSLNKDYWVYRFVSNDDYLNHLKVGDIFHEKSFISTTRNPFYDTKNNLFGFILLKILLPKGKRGVALCMESYSLFPGEEEILLSPAKLKLVSKDSHYKYHHVDKEASKRIKKLYTFEYVDSIKYNDTTKYKTFTDTIPTIDWLKDTLAGDDFESRIYYFIGTFYQFIITSVTFTL